MWYLINNVEYNITQFLEKSESKKRDIRFAMEAKIPQVLVVFNISVSLLIHLIRFLKRKELFNKVLMRSSRENSQKEKRRAIENYFLIITSINIDCDSQTYWLIYCILYHKFLKLYLKFKAIFPFLNIVWEKTFVYLVLLHILSVHFCH